jgi:hypothetical protein
MYSLSTIDCFLMQSVSLWCFVVLCCDYLNFVQEYDPMMRDRSPTNKAPKRDRLHQNLFERALGAAGLHVAQGIKLCIQDIRASYISYYI